jgi:hypothetical protein
MEKEVQRCLELLERRLVTLRRLAADLDASRSAYVALDLMAMRQHTANQEMLCLEIRAVDAELHDLKRKFAERSADGQAPAHLGELTAQFDPTSARQLHLLLGGLTAIRADVRRLSRVHSELLRRSRRSVNVLLNFLAHYSGTYPAALMKAGGIPLSSVGK